MEEKISILDVVEPNWLSNYEPVITPWYENMYYEVVAFLDKIRLFTRDTIIGFKNILKYLPIIWKDRDWDYEYAIDLLEFKLKNIRNCIVSSNIIVESSKIGEEIDKTLEFIRIFKDSDEEFENINQDKLKQMKDILDKNILEKEEKEYYKNLHNFEEQNWNNIWLSISENMRGWWD